MWNRTARQVAVVALSTLLFWGCSNRAPVPDPAVAASVGKGLACVARLYDGNSFDDDYLRYEYDGEALASPLAGYRLTYRILDAYFIVLMLRQEGVQPGDAGSLFERADTVTAALVPAWRQKGIYNLRRDPAPRGGIALDTFAILAVLRRDVEMGRVVEAGLDGDGWLHSSFYTGEQAFRRIADESWAARALLLADPPKGVERVRATIRQSYLALDSETDPVTRANLILHALEANSDLVRSSPGSGGAGDAESVASLVRLRQEGLRLLGEDTIRNDTLTLANLVAALIADRATPRESLAPLIQELLRRQGQNGCWSASLNSADTSLPVFTTLRVVLTLARYEAPEGGLR